MVDFMKWALTDGQKFATELGYAPLPNAVVEMELKALAEDQAVADGDPRARRPVRRGAASAPGRALFAVLVLIAHRRWRSASSSTRSRWLSIQQFGWQFWQTDTWDPVAGEFGARPFIWGTLYSSVLALLIATPIALGIAIFISELCPHRLRQPLVFLTELLAAIPSIVYGLWGIFVLVPVVRAARGRRRRSGCSSVPLFSGPPLGVGMLSAALILAIMVIPFTSSVAREVLKAVPQAQREGAYALGATRWEAIRMALFYARTGIVGAVMLGFGRALGETMAVTMVIGNNPQISLVAVRAAVHDGGGHRQRVHRGGRRPLPARAGRDRPRAVRHHADRQRHVAAAHLVAWRASAAPRLPARTTAGRRRPHDARSLPQAAVASSSSASARCRC